VMIFWLLLFIAIGFVIWSQCSHVIYLTLGLKPRPHRRAGGLDIGPGAGVHSIQGLRAHMEDYYQAAATLGGNPRNAFFGVFDGHGGHRAAEFCAQQLHQILIKENWEKSPESALENGFQELDESWLNLATSNGYDDGTTALCCLIQEGMMFVANVGDSRAVLCHNEKAIEMSEDHKPIRQDEKKENRSIRWKNYFFRHLAC